MIRLSTVCRLNNKSQSLRITWVRVRATVKVRVSLAAAAAASRDHRYMLNTTCRVRLAPVETTDTKKESKM